MDPSFPFLFVVVVRFLLLKYVNKKKEKKIISIIPRTNPVTLIPRVPHAIINLDTAYMIYEGHVPKSSCGPNATPKPPIINIIKLDNMIGLRPNLFYYYIIGTLR